MSFVVAAPESITTAAADLGGIGSALERAAAAAAGNTTGLPAAAADEVSIAVSRLFSAFGQDFTTLTGQAAAVHAEFVNLLNGGAAAYLGTEIANAEQTLLPGLSSAAAATVPGGAYAQLLANTTANLQSIYNNWAANPFPFLRQVLANQMGYWQQTSAAVSSAIQNFPTLVANLPATVRTGIQGLLALDPALFLQQFIATQAGFAQTFAVSLADMVDGIVTGLPAFNAGMQVAFQAVLAGDFNGAVVDVAQAFANLLVTGVDPGTVAITTTGNIFPNANLTLDISANPTLVGPLGDLFTMMGIPGQEAQYFTNLLPAGSIPRQMSQNLTNVLTALSIPSISTDVSVPLFNPPAVQYDAFFGLPLVITYAMAGAPISALNGLAASATAVQQALLAGNGVGALGALGDAPALMMNGFLNSDTLIDVPFGVPTGLPSPLPTTVSIALHLPFDGILVAPHPLTATVNVPGFEFLGFPTNVTIGGTPFMGLVPMLVDYLPEQLALAITPAA